MIKTYFKNKPIRLKGKKKTELNISVMLRDNVCQNPFCKSGFPVDFPHHIIFRSRGGSDVEENLVLTCTECHALIHKEWINVTGSAPSNLVWTDKRI